MPASKPAPKKRLTTTAYAADWKSQKASTRAISELRDALQSGTGLDVVMTDRKAPIQVIPTGSLALDDALVIGGYPVGMITEMWGPSDAGKTTQAMIAVANAQKLFPDKIAGWIDVEQTFDPGWAELMGVDLDRLMLIPNPHTAEDVADVAKQMVHRGIFSMVVVDSVGSMISRVEFEKSSDDAVVAAVARIVTRLVKMCSAMCRANSTTMLIVNQVRANISKYGGDTTRPGGFALTHHSAVRLNFRRGELRKIKIGGDEIPVGHEVVVRVEKNKRGASGWVARFFLQNQATDKYGPIGIDRAEEAFNIGRDVGIIAGSGWYTFSDTTGEDVRLQGKDKVVPYLRQHPELVERIRDQMLTANKDLTEVPEVDAADQAAQVAALLEAQA